MANIHASAIVSADAKVASDVTIGPFCVVEAGAEIGAGCVLESHVSIKGNTTLGERNVIGQGAVLGGDPQDHKYEGEKTFLRVGDDNIIREYATLHRATGEGNATVVGNKNFLMAYTHLGHNVTLHNEITLANLVQLSGHVTVEDRVNVGGMSGIHQFVRIGKCTMVSGFSKITRDAPPYMLVEGPPMNVVDINAVGLRRMGVSQSERLALHKACKLLFKTKMNLTNAIECVRREVTMTPQVEELLAFQERLFHGRAGRGDQR